MRERVKHDEKALKPKMRGKKGSMGEEEEEDYHNVSDSTNAIARETPEESASYFTGFGRRIEKRVSFV
jgi:hypothetical protein